jgi:glutamate-1-semialdehyde 2,1-aminomutase
VAFCAQSIGAMAGCYMLASPPTSFAEVQAQDVERFKRFYHRMLEAGVYFPPSPVEAFFFSSVHGDAEVDFTLEQARIAFRDL